MAVDTVKIGKFLAKLRRERGLTQEQLAEKLGTSNKTISRWENGNYLPPVEMLAELSEFYGVSINEILSGKRLDENEVGPAAEKNLKSVLEESSFSLEDRKCYFTKKWKQDHAFFMTLEMLAITAALIIGLCLNEKFIVIAAVVCGFVFSIVSYNRMMAYVERNAFKVKNNDSDKKS